ncbi:FMN-dependent NADH-azoreductase [Methylorubrum rhodesianum]|jgi:FMN-dependent NADH-azoreductase|uniref:FMN dependent NADH:quinone oxidoreductase n=1 Tax=Methylorubrum rhodesianum TaxID=29427 RepID=A0ABU9ZAU5_9HYPH|nr:MULTISPECIES: FMN-dependent NADH-azoreductase [Methylorubrum]MBB5765297.1 FMN-dependent NADH-azoreductase [Methylorubrum rhodesianum]MBI1691229.1 FMN-dependent NADH-azoreductase [Methylorubrum sp. DB1722]MBK3406389.1 FMN-dependent NADH-azoreductase [Methylorubrum rhodesianum]MBY0141223.1 FMN-dependent NADH-azoreductase [Methylorubrum populi]
MKLLHVDGSILGPHSVSRTVSAAIVDRLRAQHPGLDVAYRDLARAPLPHLSGAVLAGAQPNATNTPDVQHDVELGRQVLEEFLAADIVVIGAPLYNFTLSSQLKAWIDRILVAGITFRYGPSGAEGLAGDKRVIAVVSRGGLYGPGTPAAAAEHAETYLRTVLAFIGITAPEIIVAEGIALGPEARERALSGALDAAAALEAA